MTTLDSWHMPDGTPIFKAAEIRQPWRRETEADGPILVVLAEDYRALLRTVDRLELCLCDPDDC